MLLRNQLRRVHGRLRGGRIQRRKCDGWGMKGLASECLRIAAAPEVLGFGRVGGGLQVIGERNNRQ